jgi:hypothetical protein
MVLLSMIHIDKAAPSRAASRLAAPQRRSQAEKMLSGGRNRLLLRSPRWGRG